MPGCKVPVRAWPVFVANLTLSMDEELLKRGRIVASATAAWCAEWIPENPADGQSIEGVVVRNPFR